MSLGIHRLWKKSLLSMMNPSSNQSLIDVACGTGDIAKLFLKHINKTTQVTCVDPNNAMISNTMLSNAKMTQELDRKAFQIFLKSQTSRDIRK